MKQFLIIVTLILAGCSSTPKVTLLSKATSGEAYYQDRFIIGCVNGHLRFKKPPELNLEEAFKWCDTKFKDVVKTAEGK